MQQTSRAVRDANSNDTRTTGDNGLGSLGRAVGMETSGSIKPSATMRDSRKAQTEKASLVKANEKILYIYIYIYIYIYSQDVNYCWVNVKEQEQLRSTSKHRVH